MKKKLVLITDEFPYSLREASFLRPELDKLTERFSVTLVSKSASKTQVLPVDPAIRVLHYDRPHWLFHLPYFLLLPFDPDFREECERIRREDCPKKFLNALLSGYFIIEARLFARYLRKAELVGPENGVAIYYSYWNNYALYALTRCRKKGFIRPSARIVARTHGYDLYPERQPFLRQPMKQQTDRGLDRLYFISSVGRDFYRARYATSDTEEKYPLCRLGVPDRGLAPIPNGAGLRIFSLSNAVPVKRVPLIIEALALLSDLCVEWTHFGGGPDLGKLRALASARLSPRANISFTLPGAIENARLMERIGSSSYDLMVNVSASEGLPVSVMESFSFGIPVVATNVGGTRELVSESTGRLLSPNPTPEEIAEALQSYSRLAPEQRLALRRNAHEAYLETCSAEQNFTAFADFLSALPLE